MKNLYIVGAGGMGRELLNYAIKSQEICGTRWNIKGFLDDTPDPLAGKEVSYGVAGRILDYEPGENDVLMMGISNPADKKKLAAMLIKRGAVFENFIHPWTDMGANNVIGNGNIFYSGFGMTVNCRIGNFCSILKSVFGHDVEIGDYTTVSSNCNFMGRVKVGEGVFIGGNVGVAPGVKIGDGAYVCLGSMVLKDVPPGAKVLGNPAREIGFCDV